MTPVLHFAVETDMITWDGVRPVCGNDFRHTKILTDDPAQVTCKHCRELCGFDEQLTEVQSDLLNRRAA